MRRTFTYVLGLLFASLTSSVSAQISSPYTGAELAQGDFYLYNPESGLWLQNNDKNTGDWNTRGATGDYGFAFGVSPVDNGWRLDPKFGHNHSMNASNFYLDTNDALTIWSIIPKEVEGVSNAYYIKDGDNTLSLDDSNNLAWNTGKGDTWQLVTQAERIAYLTNNASEENPIDATFLIMDPRFANENERASAWKWNRPNGNLDNVRWFWNRRSYAVWNGANFTLTQTIENAPNGYYKLNIKGFYRDGNKDDVVTRRKEGTERLLAQYFINDDKAPVMSILDGASETWVDGIFWYPAANADAPYGHYPDNADGFNRAFQDYPNNYMNKGVISTVTTKTLKIGLEKIEANANDWVAWDEFTLTYLGPIDVSEYITALNNAIAVAESLNTDNTSAKAKDNLAAMLLAAKDKTSSVDSEEISKATANLLAAIEAVKNVDVTILRQTVAVAESGIDVTAANYAIENAMSADEVSQALFDLRAARKLNSMRMPDIYKGSAPADGKVYLFNVGTGTFLGTGSDWNTHAAVDQVGIELELIAADNGFKVKTNRGGGWMAYNGYVDTGGQDEWKFVPVEGKENVYNISSTGNDGFLLGYDPNGGTDGKKYWSTIAIDRTGLDKANNQWKIITPDERLSIIENAANDAPVDVSYLIKNASLNRQDGYDMWTKVCDGGNNGARVSTITDNHGDRAADYAWEYYEPFSFSFTQTIEGLAPGIYEVGVQGFFRNGNGGAQANVVNNGGELKQLAYLVANEEKVYLPNIASPEVLDGVPGVGDLQNTQYGAFPNQPQSSIEFFETGYYKTSVKTTVGQDGILTIGIKKDSREEMGDWVVFDNFRLKYFNEEGVTTGIRQAENKTTTNRTHTYYNLNGQKVQKAVKGLYIMDGKKVVIK